MTQRPELATFRCDACAKDVKAHYKRPARIFCGWTLCSKCYDMAMRGLAHFLRLPPPKR